MYDRAKAVAYAHQWAYSRNPAYYDFSAIGGDCTNFVSQCLRAGGAPMNYTRHRLVLPQRVQPRPRLDGGGAALPLLNREQRGRAVCPALLGEGHAARRHRPAFL